MYNKKSTEIVIDPVRITNTKAHHIYSRYSINFLGEIQIIKTSLSIKSLPALELVDTASSFIPLLDTTFSRCLTHKKVRLIWINEKRWGHRRGEWIERNTSCVLDAVTRSLKFLDKVVRSVFLSSDLRTYEHLVVEAHFYSLNRYILKICYKK